MNLLLDTHTFIWFMEGNKNLPDKTKKKIETVNNNCFLSIASIWEIAIKAGNGKLDLKVPFNKIAEYLSDTEINVLPIAFQHLQRLLNLEFIHRAHLTD